jgi:hypothetical protein
MKREVESFGRKKKPQKGKNRGYFEDEGFSPSKKDLLSQYKRKQKYRNSQDWES